MVVDSALYVSFILAHLVSILQMSLPLPKFLADLQELDLLPEKIARTIPSVFGEIAHLHHVRSVELASAIYNCAPHSFLPKYRFGIGWRL